MANLVYGTNSSRSSMRDALLRHHLRLRTIPIYGLGGDDYIVGGADALNGGTGSDTSYLTPPLASLRA